MADLPKRWAITGATGLVGNNLARLLCARGAAVRVLARGARRRELEGVAVEVVEGDLDDAAALRACFAGADVVVHAAARVFVGYGRRAEMERVNVEGTRAVCRALAPGQRLVQVSSVDALGIRSAEQPADEATAPKPEEGGVPYVDTKRAADVVVRESGVDHVIVHPTFMLGPWDWRPSSGRMLLAVARGLGRFAPAGGNNFVDVRDVCAGIVAAAQAPARSAWILGNENLSYREAWTRIAAVVGGAKPVAELPAWAGAAAARALSWLTALGWREGEEVNAASIRMGFLPHYFDPAKARRELALPATPLESTVADAWAWFQEHGYGR